MTSASVSTGRDWAADRALTLATTSASGATSVMGQLPPFITSGLAWE